MRNQQGNAPSKNVTKGARQLNVFLQNFVDKSLGDEHGLEMRINTCMHRFGRMAPEMNSDKTNILYGDTDETFQSVLFLGVEFHLMIFDLLTFCIMNWSDWIMVGAHLFGLCSLSSLEGKLDLSVEHEHKRCADTTENVGESSLVHTSESLSLENLGGTVHVALVHALLHRLVGLHLNATTDGVEWVGNHTGGGHGDLCNSELGHNGNNTELLGVWVEGHDGVVKSELGSTVCDDTGNGWGISVVQGEESSRATGGLLQAVSKTVELLLAGSDVRCETGTGVIQRVHDGKGGSSGHTA